MQDVMHSSKGDTVGAGKVPARYTAVSLHIGGNGGDDVLGSLRFFRVEMPPVFGAFPGLNFFDDAINRTF